MCDEKTLRAIHMDFHFVEYVDKILTQLIHRELKLDGAIGHFAEPL